MILPPELEFVVARLGAAAKTLADVGLQMRCRAAIAALHGDEQACIQHLAAAAILNADWSAAKRGNLEY